MQQGMIFAMKKLAKKIEDKQPCGLYDRKAVLKCNDVTIDLDSIDFEFDVPFDDDTEANEANFVIYNLSKKTISQFKYDKQITLTAGYASDTGVIFSGRVSKVKTKYVGNDKVTTVYAIDSKSLKEHDIADIAFKKGTAASTILKKLVEKLNLPVALFKTRKDYIYKDATNVTGGLMSNINKYAKVCGVSAFINKGKVYVVDVRQSPIDVAFTLSEKTGLIDSPEEFEEEIDEDSYKETVHGYSCTMLLQHRMTTAAIVKLNSLNVNGTFYVRKGNHSFNGNDFVTTVEMIAR
ncbi:MAG: hypothetical protein NC110_05280 [Ruminococcus sp.]|nr:hypothetical protein [Ruminococcus sp.]